MEEHYKRQLKEERLKKDHQDNMAMVKGGLSLGVLFFKIVFWFWGLLIKALRATCLGVHHIANKVDRRLESQNASQAKRVAIRSSVYIFFAFLIFGGLFGEKLFSALAGK